MDCKSFTTEAAKKPEDKVKGRRKKSAYKGTNGRILTGVRRQYAGSVKSPTSVMSYPANQNHKQVFNLNGVQKHHINLMAMLAKN